jgi:hypothetical protein
MTDASRHWTNEEIVTRVDEPARAHDPRREAHLAACESCRARLAAMEALFRELRAAPSAVGEIELRARRDRILAAITDRPRTARRRLSRPALWIPLAAAALIAALVIGFPPADRFRAGSPPSIDEVVRSGPSPWKAEDALPQPRRGSDRPLPVMVEANRAAGEVLQAVGDDGEAERLVEDSSIDDGIPGSPLAALDYDDVSELEEEFAGLPSTDRKAILDELADTRFDL